MLRYTHQYTQNKTKGIIEQNFKIILDIDFSFTLPSWSIRSLQANYQTQL